MTVLAVAAPAQQLLPGDDDVVVKEWSFDTDAESWAPLNNLADFTLTDGVLRTRATGDDAALGVTAAGVDCASVSHLVVRMRSTQAGTTQVYFTTSEHADPAQNAIPIFGVAGDNEFRTYEVAVAGITGWSGTLGLLRLDPVNGMGTSAEIEIDFVRLIRKAPRLELVSFAPDRVWVRPGEEVTLTLVVRDTTRGPEIPLKLIVSEASGTGGRLAHDPENGTYSRAFTVQPSGPVTLYHGKAMSDAGRATSGPRGPSTTLLVCETQVLALSKARLPQPPRKAGVTNTKLGVAISTGQMCIDLIEGDRGLAAGVVRARSGAGEWRVAGVLAPLMTEAVQERAPCWLAGELRVDSRTYRSVDLVDTRPQWNDVRVRFEVEPGRPTIRVVSSLNDKWQYPVLRFSGPTLLAGEGSFGERKDCALFPGIEFLEADQRSSSTEAVGDSLGYRPVPPPYQITVPLMAVEAGGVLCGRMWDPLQKWDGEHDMPLAEFASPNFLDEQSNHLMSTFVPGSPEWTAPNTREAQTPYEMRPGGSVVIEEHIFAVAGGRITDAVPLWYETYDLPDPVEVAKPLEATLDDLMEGWATTCYDSETDEFVNHWRAGLTPAASPGLKAAMLTHHLRTGETRWIERCRVDPATRYVDLLGSFFDGFGAGDPPGTIATQAQDGSWPYEVTPEITERTEGFTGGKRHDLGEDGTTCAGLIAVNALGILSHAAQTGNAESEASGLRALEAITRYQAPDGAQTWEVHKDIGDIYAAALIVDCFRLGYELTGDRRWLDEATYWAYTGLPFLYSYDVPGTGAGAMVSIPGDPLTDGDDPLQGTHPSSVVFKNPDREVARYASIPVFGTSFYVVSWFGNPVQWCGLCWASSVYDLLEHVDDPLLRHVADGVVASGCQQTFDKPPVVGLLPDTWHFGNNMIHPAFIGPVRVETPLRKALNRPSFSGATMRVVRGPNARAHITSRASIAGDRLTRGRLSFSLTYPEGQISETAILGLDKPKSIRVDDRDLPIVADLEQADEGWRYAADAGRIDIRVRQGRPIAQVLCAL